MTVLRARNILGKVGNGMSDDEIVALINKVKLFADVCTEKISRSVDNKTGNSFLK